jgi:hypothetical protein
MKQIVIIVVCLLFGSAFATTSLYGATKNTWGTLNEQDPDTGGCWIHGGETSMYVVNGLFFDVPIYTYALIGFDFTNLSPSTSISSALLNLTADNSLGQSGHVIEAWNVSNNWVEANFSYTGVIHGCSVWPTVGLFINNATNSANGNLSIDITSYVRYCVQNSLPTSLRLNLHLATYWTNIYYTDHSTTGKPVVQVVHS